MPSVEISKAEHGVIRIFAISRPMAVMARLLKQHSKDVLASDLLGHKVAPDDIELFALSDLAGVGLPGYLIDGYDVDPQTVRADAARLDALDGYVLLVFSRVGRDTDVILQPVADLTLIGTYHEPKAANTTAPIATDAAKPYSGVNPAPVAPRRSRLGSVVTALVLLASLFLIWWIF